MQCIRGILSDCVPPSPLEGETPHVWHSPIASLPSVEPTSVRRFTDCSCCLLYTMLLVLCLSICVVNTPNSIKNFQRPLDLDHNVCSPPYQYIYIPTSDMSRTVCVSDCPIEAGIPLQCLPNTVFRQCPSSISGLLLNHELYACHRRDILLPKPSFLTTIINCLYRSKVSYLFPFVFTSLLSAFLVGTTFLLPGVMTYVYMLLAQISLILLASLCLLRYFQGHAVIIDRYLPPTYSHPGMLLFLGIFLIIIVVISICLFCWWFRRSQMFFVVIVLRIARYCYCQSILLIVSTLLSVVCFGMWMGILWMMYVAMSIGAINYNNSEPWDQFEHSSTGRVAVLAVVILALWTHGFIVSLCHFVFQSIGTLWYYNYNKSLGLFSGLFNTVQLVFFHLGTILQGSIYEYYSQTLTSFLNQNRVALPPVFYQYLCCLHNCCCRFLLKYSLIETILNSLPFWQSNIQFYQVRKIVTMSVPQIYLYGDIYSNILRGYIVLVSVSLSYFCLTFFDAGFFVSSLHAIPHMLVIGVIAYEIATCWIDSTGMLGDTIVFNYCIENRFRMQRYGLLDAPHCPIGILNLITSAKPIII